MRWFLPALSAALGLLFTATVPLFAAPPTAYPDALRQNLDLTRRQLPAITASAEQAATRILAGGRLFAGGSQRGFIYEATGRAGGLMGLHPVKKTDQPRKGDVLLVGARPTPTKEDWQLIQQWKAAGAQVILFSGPLQEAASTGDAAAAVDRLILASPAAGLGVGQKILPLDSVMNLVNLWTWTGEFAAACTRAGKMPVFYLSYGVEGGKARGEKYKGQMFHADFKIAPIPPGVLSGQYLDEIDAELKALDGEQAKIAQAGQWLKAANPRECDLQGLGHIFPWNNRDSRAPQPFTHFQDDGDKLPSGVTFVFHLSYQAPPQSLLEQAGKNPALKVVYCSVQPGTIHPGNILYINPHWPQSDACVSIQGYDIKILPASAILQSALYWAIVAQSQ